MSSIYRVQSVWKTQRVQSVKEGKNEAMVGGKHIASFPTCSSSHFFPPIGANRWKHCIDLRKTHYIIIYCHLEANHNDISWGKVGSCPTVGTFRSVFAANNCSEKRWTREEGQPFQGNPPPRAHSPLTLSLNLLWTSFQLSSMADQPRLCAAALMPVVFWCTRRLHVASPDLRRFLEVSKRHFQFLLKNRTAFKTCPEGLLRPRESTV